MAFLAVDPMHNDTVTFYVRKDFSNNPCVTTHYVERGDITALRSYIKNYMDTTVTTRRPDTPANIIIDRVPDDYEPPF